MQWDLGLQGLGVLALMSLGLGLVTQLVASRGTTRWIGLIGAAAYFVGGLFISEVLLIGLVPGIAAVLVTRYVTRGRTRRVAGHGVPRHG